MPIYFGTQQMQVRFGTDRQYRVVFDATDIIGKARYVVTSENGLDTVVSEDGQHTLISE